jgi:hypothetical protein
MASLLISQVRKTSRDRPARLARSSRVSPAKARPARNKFPVSFGSDMVKFSLNQYDKHHTAHRVE